MMTGLVHLAVAMSAVANAIGRFFLAPVAYLPGWLSATIIAVVTGLLLLFVFRFTSNQAAIKRVRNGIKANLLALKLFKDSPIVTFRAQGCIYWGAFRLMLYAIVPMLVMAVPVCLLLSQIALWYEARPLHAGEEAVIEVKVKSQQGESIPEVTMSPSPACDVIVGPVHVATEGSLYWRVRAKTPGQHHLRFNIAGTSCEKDFVVGEGFQRVSLVRPGLRWSDILSHPCEPPFDAASVVQSIAIDYPDRVSWTTGSKTWLAYWFIVSMVAAFVAKPWFNVNF